MDDVKQSPGWLSRCLRWLRHGWARHCMVSGLAQAVDGLHPSWTVQMPWLELRCQGCGVALDMPGLCGRCLAEPPPYLGVYAPWHYAFPIDRMIQRYKFHAALALGPVLARGLAEALRAERDADQPWPDGLVPVPCHRQRIRQRGFDHVGMLAADLAAELNLSLARGLLQRRRHTAPQTGMTKSQRRDNLRGAFAVNGQLPKRVALLDDVVTTGATVDACTRVLLAAGAETVEVWALARA